jgi:hypothetical protein
VLHLVLYGLLALALAGALFLVAARFLPAGEQIAPPLRDEPLWELPSRAVSAEDVEGVRLPVALRGYRFAETDLLLDRLAGEIRARDELIAQLRAGAVGTAAAAAGAAAITGGEYDAPTLPFEEAAPRIVRPPYGPPPAPPAYRPPPVDHGQYAPPPPPPAAANGEPPAGYPIPQDHYRYLAPDTVEAPPWAVLPVAVPGPPSEGEAEPSQA